MKIRELFWKSILFKTARNNTIITMAITGILKADSFLKKTNDNIIVIIKTGPKITGSQIFHCDHEILKFNIKDFKDDRNDEVCGKFKVSIFCNPFFIV
ncbi:MAG: hypothetical protein ACXWFB_12850, partial [Nitrososphaeraceae archaeon]